MLATDIRRRFLDFFVQEGHQEVASSPLVPRNDSSLLFANSGMVQFKNVFIGKETREYTTATSAQKCIRAGGKHNDLDNVGYTARHHTFFEMLGNSSFGDYFKARAIELAWRFVVHELGLDRERLWVTTYHDDEEAIGLWKSIAGLKNERILRISTSDNFWQMGDTGPCGPCSEIFYDHGEHVAGGLPGTPQQDGDRYVEIWNLVFMQYERQADGTRLELPNPSIDTGMGIERIAAVLQGHADNYDTDLLSELVEQAAELCGVSAARRSKAHANSGTDSGHGDSVRAGLKVIADHVRSSAFLIADGVLPGNEGRPYVLRRIMRRAMRHAHSLGATEPVMYRLVPSLVESMGGHYGELTRARALIEETLRAEEERFRRVLVRGMQILTASLDEIQSVTQPEAESQAKPKTTQATEATKAQPSTLLSGELAFKLYDTYGFPPDLTADVARARGIDVDIRGFNEAMAAQHARARQSWSGSGEQEEEKFWLDLADGLGKSEFLGYQHESASGIVREIIDAEDAMVLDPDKATSGTSVRLVMNQTPFYAESGGQQGDRGLILGEDSDLRVRVTDTQFKSGGQLIVHHGVIENGCVNKGDSVRLRVDSGRRASLRAHHSATHLLHAALRDVLGEHVTQKGSLVAPDRLRFDFSHGGALTEEECRRVEHHVNAQILANSEVSTRLMETERALQAGALALFGEKYGDEVRVVSMGTSAKPTQKEASQGKASPTVSPTVSPTAFSLEFCGGTHVRRTGDIGMLKIVAESAVGAGVRRLEAVAHGAAREAFDTAQGTLKQAAARLKTTPAEFLARLESVLADNKKQRARNQELQEQLALLRSSGMVEGTVAGAVVGGVTGALSGENVVKGALKGAASGLAGAAARKQALGSSAQALGDGVCVSCVLHDLPPQRLRDTAEKIRADHGSQIALVASDYEGKASLVVAAAKNSRVNAVDLVRIGARQLGGSGGGGRADLAQAGGLHVVKVGEAIAAIEKAIAQQVA